MLCATLKLSLMKRLFSLFVVCVAIILASCTTRNTLQPRTTAGNAYDVFIICPNEAWRGELASSVCDMLEADAPGLTRPEGYFNIFRQADEKGATDIDRKYPNILKLDINPVHATPSTRVAKNVYARPQMLVTISAPDAATAAKYIELSADALRGLFEAGEREASNQHHMSHSSPELMDDFEAHTGLRMVIPANYYKATTRDEDLLWYIRDYEKKAQYIFAYSYDYVDGDDLTAEWLMRSLDNRLAIISSKDAVGSYMGVNEEGPAVLTEVDINGRTWYELRGWWEVKGDFMGGPFVSYSTLDSATNRITTIMFALYAPEEGQRNPLREIEHLIYTIK